MIKKIFVYFLCFFAFVSCIAVFPRIRKEPVKGQEEFSIGHDSTFVIKSVSILERECFACIERIRKDFPLKMTNRNGTKNIHNVHKFITKLNQNGFKIKINTAALNDSMFFYSKQEWTKRIWGKKPPPQNINGNMLIISINYYGDIGSSGHDAMGISKTVYEFVKVQNSEVIGFASIILKRGSYDFLIKYRDLKKVFRRLKNE